MTMRYSDDELRDRLQLGEDSGWEFKAVEFRGPRPAGSQRAQWADEIVAFSNAAGGVMLLGVSDEGQVDGMSREQLDAVEQMVVEICRDTVSPAVRAAIYKVNLDGRSIVLVEVPAGDGLYERDGRSYLRVGSAKQLMSSDERIRLALRRGQSQRRSFDESPLANTGFATLSERLWMPLLSSENLAEPAIGLEKLGLLSEDDQGRLRASVGGALLCMDQPEAQLPHAVITATAYRGSDEASGQLDARTITGPLDRQVADGVAFVRRNMRVGAVKDPARIDMPEYSARAVFEGLVNAVAHRDYSINSMRIRLRMFSDRLEICSPGPLPNGLTIEKMASLQATRNVVLASNLSRMRVAGIEGSGDRRHFMDSRGDGVLHIQRETHALTGRMPHFELIDDIELRLTIPAAIPESESFRTFVNVHADGRPQPDVEVLVLFPNGTYRLSATDQLGVATFDLHTGRLPMTVYVAAPALSAHLERDWVPADRDLQVELTSLDGGGSVILPSRVGHIPGLKGRVNPRLDDVGRTYLYASNIAINDGQPQPVYFQPGGEELHFVDAFGKGQFVRIVAINGESSLIEYRAE